MIIKEYCGSLDVKVDEKKLKKVKPRKDKLAEKFNVQNYSKKKDSEKN